MGIFTRMNRVIKSNLNSLVDKAEDPEKLISQTVLEMEGELKTAKRELVQQLGTAKRLIKQAQEHEDEAKRWEEKAVLALRSGDDDLAREALRRKQRALSKSDEVKQQAYAAENASIEMKDALENVEKKIEDLKARKGTLAAQVRRAREGAAGTGTGGTRYGSETFDELERMTGRIDELEAEIEASNVLDDPKRSEVEAKFRRLERETRGSAVDDELAALKAKLDG
jgi:phage shock protein A